MKKIFYLSLLTLLLSACASSRKQEEPSSDLGRPSSPVVTVAPAKEVIDLRALQSSVRMDRAVSELGFRERSFNTCRVGAGFSSTQNCRPLNLVVIHFKLMCRDSEGTVSEAITAANLQPIANSSLTWHLKNASDQIMTDADGLGQIVMVSPGSQRGERLRLTLGSDFLALRAGEVKTLIAPQNWCQ